MKKIALLLAMIATGASAGLIDFTTGYTDGGLNGQQDWNAEAGWTVDSGNGFIAATGNNEAATLNQAVVLSSSGLNTYNMSINFQFSGTYATPTGFVYAFMAGLKPTSDGASLGTGDATGADANIQILTDPNFDDYRLLNGYSSIAGAATIDGETDPLAAGDILVFDYSLTLGTDAASSFYTVRLQNTTDGTDTGIGTITGIAADTYTALTGTGAFAYFQTINAGGNGSGLTGVQVNSIVTDVVPEPATVGMLGLGALITLLVRRMRS